MEDKVAQDFGQQVWEVGQKSYRHNVLSHIQWMKHETTGYLVLALLCVALAWRYSYDHSHKPPDQQVTIGKLQAYMVAFGSLQGQLMVLFQLSTFKAAAQAGVKRIQAVLKTASTTPDPIGFEATIPQRGRHRFV